MVVWEIREDAHLLNALVPFRLGHADFDRACALSAVDYSAGDLAGYGLGGSHDDDKALHGIG